MTNETKPVLLTEAEARAIYLAATSPDDFNRRLRERGLIAPEPVDPLLIEAREIVASMPTLDALQADAYRRGEWDAGGSVDIALAALKRGMELAKPELTVAQELAERMVPIVQFLAEAGAEACGGYSEWVDARWIAAALEGQSK